MNSINTNLKEKPQGTQSPLQKIIADFRKIQKIILDLEAQNTALQIENAKLKAELAKRD